MSFHGRMCWVVLHSVMILPGCTTKTAPKNDPVPVPESAQSASSPSRKKPESTHGDQLDGRAISLKTRLTGKWLKVGVDAAEGCYCGSCLDIQFDKVEDNFCVEDNQIWVSAYYKLDEANKQVGIYFNEPTDLGTGGASLPWDLYDRKKPIGLIDISNIDKKILKVKWISFTEKSGKKAFQPYGEWYAGDYRALEAP